MPLPTTLVLRIITNPTYLDLRVTETALQLVVFTPSVGPAGPAGPGMYPIETDLSSDGSVTIPAGKYVWSVAVSPNSTLSAFRIGSTEGGQEIFPDTEIPADTDPYVVVIMRKYNDGKTLYFGGITSDTHIEVIIS